LKEKLAGFSDQWQEVIVGNLKTELGLIFDAGFIISKVIFPTELDHLSEKAHIV